MDELKENEQEKINEPKEFGDILGVPVLEKMPTAVPFMQLAIPASIIIAGLLISGTIFLTREGSPLAKNKDIKKNDTGNIESAVKVNSNDHILGNKNAEVTVIEYSDFQCPFCRLFWKNTYSQLKKEYIDTGKIQFVYRHFPLDIHPLAVPSAKGVECAAEQGKFWEFHDKFFQEQEKLGQGTVQYTVADIKKWAGQIGLKNAFNQCLDSDKYSERVNSDLNTGREAQISGTPTFFVNGVPLIGAQPFSAFKTAIDSALEK